jgi:hypothetical protein
MQNLSTRTVATFGTGFGMALLISAVWTADVSVSTALAMTALLVLVSVALVVTARGVCSPIPEGAADEQRERMRANVP